jgi:hypothetical protein
LFFLPLFYIFFVDFVFLNDFCEGFVFLSDESAKIKYNNKSCKLCVFVIATATATCHCHCHCHY